MVQSVMGSQQFHILGPAPAPMLKLRDRYRYRILVKSNILGQKFVKQWVEGVKIPPSVRLTIDVDPYNFM